MINPASYAFSIWTPIYVLYAIFLLYQWLPDSWVANRNENLLYQNGIGYWMAASTLACLVWFFFINFLTTWGWFLALVSIAAMLGFGLVA